MVNFTSYHTIIRGGGGDLMMKYSLLALIGSCTRNFHLADLCSRLLIFLNSLRENPPLAVGWAQNHAQMPKKSLNQLNKQQPTTQEGISYGTTVKRMYILARQSFLKQEKPRPSTSTVLEQGHTQNQWVWFE